MEKSRDAFRTISEVAEWLDVPTHVLRFWESRFSQIKPVKRAGGRRYYRPSDMRVIGGVKVLLHDQGMTIRGVQKLFREQGIKHVSSFSPKLFGEEIEEESVPVVEHDGREDTQLLTPPASAARATREAEPTPIEDAEIISEATAHEETSPDDLEKDAHREEVHDAAVPIEELEASHPSEPDRDDETADVGPAVFVRQTDYSAQQKPKIPEADVPERDAADNDISHARSAGTAARLKLLQPSVLLAHHETLSNAARHLRAIHERMS